MSKPIENEQITFEQALAESEELFGNGAAETAENEELASETETVDEPVAQEAEQPAMEETVAEDNVSEEAVAGTEQVENQAVSPELQRVTEMAEKAAMAAQERDGQLQQLSSQMQDILQQNEALKKTIMDMSKQNEEAIMADAAIPYMDLNEMAFLDEETARAKQTAYFNDVLKLAEASVLKKLEPIVSHVNAEKQASEKNAVIDALANMEEMKDIRAYMPQIERIIKANKWLQSEDMDTDERLINAYALARGVNDINTPKKEMTADEFLELFKARSDLQEAVEKERIQKVKDAKGQQVPTLSASGGAGGAALNISEKPKTMEDASERTRKLFGF